MIYAGTSTNESAPEQIGLNTAINNGEYYIFNNSWDKAEYVGYQYTLGQRNGLSEDSNAKTIIDNWFSENLMEEYEAGYVAKNAGFCGDRSITTGTGIGDEYTVYGPYTRTIETYGPTFLCEDKEHDLYTVKEASEGTHSLTYPIGLSTIDEQVYAGNYWGGSNTKYYLYNGYWYWTMSPYGFGGDTYVFRVGEGYLFNIHVGAMIGLRPVINLVAGSLTKGDGTASNPFRVS